MMADAVSHAVIDVSALVPQMWFQIGVANVASAIFDGIRVKLPTAKRPRKPKQHRLHSETNASCTD